MRDFNLWQQLVAAKLVSGDAPETARQREGNLWYVRALQGFGGWLAAAFLMGFLGIGVAGLFDNGAAMITLGLVVNISTFVFFRTNPDSDFFEQMVLAFSLTGQLLVMFGLLELLGYQSQQWLWILALYQVALVFLVKNYIHRFLSTCFAVIAMFWSFEWMLYTGLGVTLVAALFVWIWLDRAGWESEKEFYEPIGYALGVSLMGLNVQNLMWFNRMFYMRSEPNLWLYQNAPMIAALLASAVLLYFVYRAAQEQAISWSTNTGKLIILAGVLLLFSAMPVIGLSSALLVLLTGFARQRIMLQVLGALSLLGFVSWYYYSLTQTLLVKSLILMVMGVVLTAGFLLLRRIFTESRPQEHQTQTSQRHDAVTAKPQKWAALLTLLLALVGVNHAIYQKEHVLDSGRSVMLELAPVDPRSIMQGDFMRLRFDMANKIFSGIDMLKDRESSYDGFVVVDVDEKSVGTFNAIYNNQSLKDNQVLMQFRKRKGRIQFATNAFFFQEGDAKLFDAAKYGEFKVADDGELLLKAMYDQDLQLLGENRLD